MFDGLEIDKYYIIANSVKVEVETNRIYNARACYEWMKIARKRKMRSMGDTIAVSME